MTNNKPIKCFNCNKVFFDFDNTNKCPFCKELVADDLDSFKELFGKDNPFSDLVRGEQK